ncbi:MAG TPA: hypothetical protein VK513_04755 [Terriglobales bacterium]|nr:hypothetical protein [Terriglobales bacterium]
MGAQPSGAGNPGSAANDAEPSGIKQAFLGFFPFEAAPTSKRHLSEVAAEF